MAVQHVWTGWTNDTPQRQKRVCLRCGQVQYRYYGTQPG